LRKMTTRTAADIGLPSFELAVLAPLCDRFERENFQCPLLKSLQSQLMALSGRASRRIRVLSRLVWLLDLRKSEYFALPSLLLLWGTNFALLIERWRRQNRKYLGQWLDSLGQFEALLCLARYYYENPGHTFAVIKPQSAALFHAKNLGHPLLDRDTCIKCDLQLEAGGIQLMMVSGSNMSGKSTLLRSVGVNAVLALCGAPVCANRLEISRLQIACSIGVQDSFAQSKSRFQAEVERLKAILVLSRANSTLFLLDELLSGTNSNDRYCGAKAIIEQLLANGAAGLVTTHDLALTEVVKAAEERAINVHFQERYENGEMQFDYRMRAGVLTSTNGVNIMAALGLLTSSKEAESYKTEVWTRKPGL
jgi:DNA mismatch repair ATPase MutS